MCSWVRPSSKDHDLNVLGMEADDRWRQASKIVNHSVDNSIAEYDDYQYILIYYIRKFPYLNRRTPENLLNRIEPL
jgi:hypothetical protein